MWGPVDSRISRLDFVKPKDSKRSWVQGREDRNTDRFIHQIPVHFRKGTNYVPVEVTSRSLKRGLQVQGVLESEELKASLASPNTTKWVPDLCSNLRRLEHCRAGCNARRSQGFC